MESQNEILTFTYVLAVTGRQAASQQKCHALDQINSAFYVMKAKTFRS